MEKEELMVGGKNILKTTFDNTGIDWENAKRPTNSKVELLEEVEMMKEEDVIEGMEERSIEEIIQEVADEEGLSVEEVREMVKEFQNKKFQVAKKKRMTKKKRDKSKEKAKKKQAKKSSKKNR